MSSSATEAQPLLAADQGDLSQSHLRRASLRPFRQYLGLGVVTGLVVLVVVHIVFQRTNPEIGHVGSSAWNSSTPIYRSPTSTIGWHVCPDNPKDVEFLCSTFDVPLNWIEPIPGENATIFMRMLPADEGERRGSLVSLDRPYFATNCLILSTRWSQLVNPGGPGFSSNYFCYNACPSLKILTKGVFDIVAFDPRGVNMSTPKISAYMNDYTRELANLELPNWKVEFDPTKAYNYSSPSLRDKEVERVLQTDRRSKLERDLSVKHSSVRSLKSVSTTFVARDMMALVDALGDEGGMLNYIGYSYGSLLGAIFAAMFPDRIGRMVLDGVEDARNYSHDVYSAAWASLIDTDEVFKEFCAECIRSGPHCALATKESTTAIDIEVAVDNLAHTLYESPMAVMDSNGGPGFVTVTTLYLAIFKALYKPTSWPKLATAIHSALAGNGTSLLEMDAAGLPPALINPVIGLKDEWDNVFGMRMGDGESIRAIICSDADLEQRSVDEVVDFTARLHERSKFAVNIWMTLFRPCHSWTDRPFERYAGPWSRADGLRRTRNKILWVGNTLDPVTPLSSAQGMYEAFGNDSGTLLIHDGPGHTSAAVPSLCTIQAIQDYLLNGVIPVAGTRCKAETGSIFPQAPGMKMADLKDRDAGLMDAMKVIRDGLQSFRV